MNFKNLRMHFIGIGGISLSALAQLALNKGAIVTGSDISKSDETEKLENLGVSVFYCHKKENVVGSDVVIYSSAIKEDNPELVEAKQRKLKIMKRAELLAEISKEFPVTIAVCGSHGKTTTTAMVANLLINAKLDPTVHLGGEYGFIGGNVRIGGGDFFVTEACEYKDNFLYLTPQISVCLNVSPDHLDYFKTFDNVKTSFGKFINRTRGIVISNSDDNYLVKQKHQLTFSIENKGDVCAVNIKEYERGKFSFDVIFDGSKRFNVKLGVYGRHNIYNALSAICVGFALKINEKIIKCAIEGFTGVDRRFQEVGLINGAKIIVDYAHHPDEIKASIISAKNIAKGRVIAIFQPHTFTRTKAFLNEFAESLALADKVAVFKIYPAREVPISGVDHNLLAELIRKNAKDCSAIDNYCELAEYIYDNCRKDDVILIMGAGDYVKICKMMKFD